MLRQIVSESSLASDVHVSAQKKVLQISPCAAPRLPLQPASGTFIILLYIY